jgi:hypothetical protein
MILVTPKAGAKLEILFNKSASGEVAPCLSWKAFQSSLIYVIKARSVKDALHG